MHRVEQVSENPPKITRATASGDGAQKTAATPAGGRAGGQEPAALGPRAEPVSAAETPAPAPPADSPAEARGRRILSTAFVRIGPDGHLSVELHGGHSLVLRDVVMRRRKYCGVQAHGSQTGARYCGGYAEVAAARPGPAPVHDEPDLAIAKPR